MQAGTVSRLRFCVGSWALKIYFGWNDVHFWKFIRFVPRNWMLKKQTSVSYSPTESETISLDVDLRMDGIPTLDLWDPTVAVLHGNTHQNNQERRDTLWAQLKIVLHLTRFTSASNLREWSMIRIMLILVVQTFNLLIRNLCYICWR